MLVKVLHDQFRMNLLKAEIYVFKGVVEYDFTFMNKVCNVAV